MNRPGPLLLALVATLTLSCARTPSSSTAASRSSPATGTVSAPAPGVEELTPRVTFPGGFTVRVEVVADNESRAQGLMYRTELLPATGMLFIFPKDGEYSFWMKNTLIPLDILWIDAEQRIVHVKHGVPPCEIEDCPSYSPGVPARHVLEVASGVAAEHGLASGQQVRFDDIPRTPLR